MLAWLAVFVAAPYFHPALARFRVLTPLASGQGLTARMRPRPSPPPVGEVVLSAQQDEAPPNPADDRPPMAAEASAPDAAPAPLVAAPVALEDGQALEAFFAQLARVDAQEPGRVARIVHYGDSIVASDLVTGTLRRELQRRFGDAGPGFAAIAHPWPGHGHPLVSRVASPGWSVSRIVGPRAQDGLYGLAGVSFRASGSGVASRLSTKTRAAASSAAVSELGVLFLAHPAGSPFDVRIDGALVETVDSDEAKPRSAFVAYRTARGDHEIEIRARGPNVRAFGVWLENDGPGVVLDAIGVQGARLSTLGEIDEAHWIEQLVLRAPSLVTFQFGMNEAEDGETVAPAEVEAAAALVLGRVRRALPDAACLVVGAMDRADARSSGMASRSFVVKLVELQRRAARASGCAFWDTHRAMGGAGSMGSWVRRGLGARDLAHPTGAGAELLGQWLFAAMMDAYGAYRAREAGAP